MTATGKNRSEHDPNARGPQTIDYASPATATREPTADHIFWAYARGVQIFCIAGALIWALFTGWLSIIVLMLFVGVCQTAMVWLAVRFRFRHRRLLILPNRGRAAMIVGFFNSLLIWLTYWMLVLQLKVEDDSDDIVGMLLLSAVGIAFSITAVAALGLTSDLLTPGIGASEPGR